LATGSKAEGSGNDEYRKRKALGMTRNLIIGATVVAVIVAGFAVYRIETSPKEAAIQDQPAGSSMPSDGGSAYNQAFIKSFIPATHDSCVKSATNQAKQNGSDPASTGTDKKIETYCSCMADEMATAMSVSELQSLTLDNKSEPAATKLKTVLQACLAKIQPQSGAN